MRGDVLSAMNGMKEWLKKIAEDEELRKKLEEKEEPKEIVALAKEYGSEITEDELMDLQMEHVNGGAGFLVTALGTLLLGVAQDFISDKVISFFNKDKK